MKLQITEHGRRRVASDDFARTMAKVIALASEKSASQEEAAGMVDMYVASVLITDAAGRFTLSDNLSEMSVFMRDNYRTICETVRNVMQSPAFLGQFFGMYADDPHVKAMGGQKASWN